jgi:hypothetical protein
MLLLLPTIGLSIQPPQFRPPARPSDLRVSAIEQQLSGPVRPRTGLQALMDFVYASGGFDWFAIKCYGFGAHK